MTQTNILELAKQGDVKAIADLMNRQLQPKGITAKVALKDGCLQIMLESVKVPDQQALVTFICKRITGLGAELIEKVKIYGLQTGEEFPAWSQEFELVLQTKPISPTLEVHTINQPSITGDQVHKNKKLSTTRRTISTSDQDINLNSKKLFPEKKLNYTAFFIFLGLSVLLLTVNWIWAIIVFITACCVAPQTPQQQKTEFHQKAENLTEVIKKGLLDANEQVTFYQMASYRGGIRGYPNSAQSSGFAFVLNHSFVFYDKDISFKVLYERVIEAKLDFFQLGGVRGILGLGDVGRQLQQTKNILELSYLDDENTERSAKFQINGAFSIPGEAEKAVEFLNHLLEFKGKFEGKSTGSVGDPLSRLEKLKKLKDQEVITEAEFEAKKRGLLDQL
jgi:hypothetical protein